MAGTLLLISKDSKSRNNFNKIKEKLRLKTKEIFGNFFYEILFKDIGNNSFLIQFRKDEEIKYHSGKDGSWITFEGTVFALHETKKLGAEELLKLYKKDKVNFPNNLDGHFVIKMYDAQEDKYLVYNDFIKNKTNYLCETDKYIMFSPFAITSALIKKPILDQEALNEFLWRYYILSEKSILEGVHRFMPASEFVYSNRNLSHRIYWEWPKKQTDLSFREMVNQTCKSMKESACLVSESFGKPCIDFTMGQDSRQVLSSYTNQNLDFVTNTYGKPDFLEVKKINEVTEKMGIEHKNILLTEEYTDNLWEYFKNSILLGSCNEPGYLLGRINFMRQQQSEFANVSVNGMDGNPYKNGIWDDMYMLNLYREPKSFKINSFIKLRISTSNYNESIFTSEFLTLKNNSEKYFKKLIKSAISGYEDCPVSMQVDRFDVYHWKNFVITSNNSGNILHNSISPLYLRRNMERALQAPARWRFNQSAFQRAIVYQLDPELAKIKTDFGGVNMVPKNILTFIPHYIRFIYFQTNRLRKKIKNRLGFSVKSHLQEAWDYKPLYFKLLEDNEFRKYLKYEHMHLNSILKEEAWNIFLNRFNAPDELKLKEFEFLFKLVSVELFLNEANKWAEN